VNLPKLNHDKRGASKSYEETHNGQSKALCTSPVNPVGMALAMRVMNSGIRGPNLSTKGPNRNRTKKEPDTAAMEDVQICCLVNPKSC
jgi:hypothetical protein